MTEPSDPASPNTLVRKLVTILSADVAGYSRLMAEDEEQTLITFRAHSAVFEALVAQHRGRIFNRAGDAILAEFESAVEAVRCATDIQAALQTRNASVPEDRRVQFRIGINLGDVLRQGDDLLGDGVNVAARLQSAAAPGGICLSGSVYDQIRNKLSLSFKPLGEVSYKNIPHPIRTFSVIGSEEGALPEPRPARSKSMRLAAGAIVLLAIAGVATWLWSQHRDAKVAEVSSPAPVAPPATPTPATPTTPTPNVPPAAPATTTTAATVPATPAPSATPAPATTAPAPVAPPTAVASAAPAQSGDAGNAPSGKDADTAKIYEDAFWDAVKDSSTPQDLQAYLNKYPHGRYVGQAQDKLKALAAVPPAPAASSAAPPAPTAPAALPEFQAITQPIYTRERTRLRATPDKNGEVLTRVAANVALKASGRSADGAWWRVAMDDGRTAYVAASAVSDQPPPAPAPAQVAAPVTPAPATPAPSPAQQASSAPASPPSAKDQENCPKDSKAALEDRIAACERLVAGATDKDAKVSALVELGNNLYDANRVDEALKNYQAALAIDPANAAAYFDIGLIRGDQGRYADAAAAFDKAAQLEPRDAEAIYQRGLMRGNSGNFDSARADIERAISLKSDVPDYYNQLGFLELVRGDADAAAKAIDQATSDPQYWSATAYAVYYLQGAMDKSLEQAERGIRDNPGYAYGWIWKALIQRSKGDAAGANQSLGEALKATQPGDWPTPLLQFMLGRISEDRLRALADTGDSRTRNERLCEISFYRGELAYLAGDKESARAAMQVALGTRVYYYVEYAAAKMRLAQLND